MTRTELLSVSKPILFNTEMVRAILDGRKTETRRVVKLKYGNTHIEIRKDKYGKSVIELQNDVEGETFGTNPDGSHWRKLLAYIEKNPPYKKGNILYVRETWAYGYEDGTYIYRASDKLADLPTFMASTKLIYHPSIHMPKEAARLFLKVTDVKAERLQDIKPVDVIKEGAYDECWNCLETYGENGNQCCYGQEDECSQCDSVIMEFEKLWNSTIPKKNRALYGWGANPWVWVVDFEKINITE